MVFCWPLFVFVSSLSFGHYIVCSPFIYGFWLPHSYLQTFLHSNEFTCISYASLSRIPTTELHCSQQSRTKEHLLADRDDSHTHISRIIKLGGSDRWQVDRRETFPLSYLSEPLIAVWVLTRKGLWNICLPVLWRLRKIRWFHCWLL